MLIENQKIQITWQNRTKAHFVEKGYEFTSYGDSFYVDAFDLLKTSRADVKVICDYCKKEFVKKYCDYIVGNKKGFGDCCCGCSKFKRKKTNLKKYGCEWYTQAKEFKQQSEKTMIDRYGTIHGLQVKEFKEKFKKTCLENNGVCFPMESDKVKEKRKETCLEKYGVENFLESKEVRKIIENTCLEKYGVKTTALVPEIREKQRKALYKNGSIASSLPERNTIKLLKDIYGEQNCIPQFPTKYYNLDCLLLINNIKIDVEYDGQWCHNSSFDNRRDKYHINHGYKILRIKGNHKIPTKKQLMESINKLLKDNCNYFELILEKT